MGAGWGGVHLPAEKGATCPHPNDFQRVPTSPSPLCKLSGPVTRQRRPLLRFCSTGPKIPNPQGVLVRPSPDAHCRPEGPGAGAQRRRRAPQGPAPARAPVA